jgi:hypothetical protein
MHVVQSPAPKEKKNVMCCPLFFKLCDESQRKKEEFWIMPQFVHWKFSSNISTLSVLFEVILLELQYPANSHR